MIKKKSEGKEDQRGVKTGASVREEKKNNEKKTKQKLESSQIERYCQGRQRAHVWEACVRLV